MKYNYVEKAVQVTRREFLGMTGIVAAVLWTGAYAVTDIVEDRNKYIKMRAAGLYKDDEKHAVRQSHKNKSLMSMYDKLAAKPMSPLAEELFHTKYVDRAIL
jgi:ferredoxin hydrogenase small subunit